ncbi:MAG: acyltransferase [Rhodobacter sp.]|nr:acyltransferase [Rhodobacter sp.]
MSRTDAASGAGFEAYKARDRFANLDGLRTVCIGAVLWHHANPLNDSTSPIFQRGFLGVDFFFVLSGYLITTLLLREAESTGRISLKNFYMRRFLRIVPVYFFVVGAVSAYFILVKGQTQYLELVPYYLLFLSNFIEDGIPLLGITWSLSVEEQYYLLWPLLLILLPWRYILPFGLFLVFLNVAGIMGLFGSAGHEVGPLTLKLPNATYAPIIMGSLLAYMLHHRRYYRALQTALGGRWTALWGFGLLLILMHALPPDLRGLPNLAIHLTMTAILAALILREDSVGHGFFQTPLIARIGVVSYGIYLYHLIARDIVSRGLSAADITSEWPLFLFYSVLAYLIAEGSFRTLEAWFRRFRPGYAKPQPG